MNELDFKKILNQILGEDFHLDEESPDYMQIRDAVNEISAYDGEGLSAALYYERALTDVLTLMINRLIRQEKVLSPHRHRGVRSADRKKIEGICRIIDSDLSVSIENEELARVACMSPSKLKYTFKNVTGTSISEYRSRQRMKAAEEMLRTTPMTVAEVSERVGFQSPGSFSDFFRRRSGCSPSEYRGRL